MMQAEMRCKSCVAAEPPLLLEKPAFADGRRLAAGALLQPSPI